MTRIFVDAPLAAGRSVTLPEDASRHVAQVLRMQNSESVTLFNGQGGEYQATIESVRKTAVNVRCERFDPIERESVLHLTLAQALVSADKMDWIAQKAVELGAMRIVPLICERSVARLSGEREGKRIEHWRKVVIAACEQSGRNRVPVVDSPLRMADFTVRQSQGLRLLLDPAATAPLPSALQGAQEKSAEIIVAVGPEGGFTGDEAAQAAATGFQRVRLGKAVLRTETAGIAALAAIQAICGAWT